MIIGTIQIHQEEVIKETTPVTTGYYENNPWDTDFNSFSFTLESVLQQRKNVQEAIENNFLVGKRVQYKSSAGNYVSKGVIIGYHYLPFNKTTYNPKPDYIRVLLDSKAITNYKLEELTLIEDQETTNGNKPN